LLLMEGGDRMKNLVTGVQRLKKLSLKDEQRISLGFGRFSIMAIGTIILVMVAFNLMNQPSTFAFLTGLVLLVALVMFYIPKAIRLTKNLVWAWRGK